MAPRKVLSAAPAQDFEVGAGAVGEVCGDDSAAQGPVADCLKLVSREPWPHLRATATGSVATRRPEAPGRRVLPYGQRPSGTVRADHILGLGTDPLGADAHVDLIDVVTLRGIYPRLIPALLCVEEPGRIRDHDAVDAGDPSARPMLEALEVHRRGVDSGLLKRGNDGRVRIG